MTSGNHVLLRDQLLEGKEYGSLRSFENAIIEQTNASVCEIPAYAIAPELIRHFGHGMNRGRFRKYFPKQQVDGGGDTVWCILMGPENYRLDLYTGWQKKYKKKILYLFDTLPAQYPLIKKLFSDQVWDVLITSFNDAVDDLQRLTGRKWHFVEQAVDSSLFHTVPLAERTIPFSAYGRRHPETHEILKEFCHGNGLYYDYTLTDTWKKGTDAKDLYRQYTWHLNHSVFTCSWPVELTNPKRAGHLHPVTCRWFEAAAAGTVMIGKAPANEAFESLVFPGAVQPLSITQDRKLVLKQLEDIWGHREQYYAYATKMQLTNCEKWTWQDRVNRILSLL